MQRPAGESGSPAPELGRASKPLAGEHDIYKAHSGVAKHQVQQEAASAIAKVLKHSSKVCCALELRVKAG